MTEAAATPVPHTAIRLIEPACTSCMACARECPSWCISIGSHPETVRDNPAARARTVHVLDEFTIDWSLCMFCGICIEVCPFDALAWSDQRVAPTASLSELAASLRDGVD